MNFLLSCLKIWHSQDVLLRTHRAQKMQFWQFLSHQVISTKLLIHSKLFRAAAFLLGPLSQLGSGTGGPHLDFRRDLVYLTTLIELGSRRE